MGTEKRVDFKKNILTILAVLTAILISVLGIYAWKGIYPFGDRTMAWGDMAQQTIPMYYYLYDLYQGKTAAFFSWQVAAGNNMAGVVAEWSLLSPLNLLILLSKRENLYHFVSLLLLFKILCMAISMYIFTGRYKLPYFYRAVLSFLYACSACVLVHYQSGFMIDLAVFFPLLMLGLYHMLDTGEGMSALYILMLALCLAINIYIGVMVLIYVFLASGLYIRMNINKEMRPEKVRRLAIATGMAMMISAVIWIPAVLHILNSGRFEKGGIIGWIGTYILACKYHWTEEDWHYTHFFLINASFFLAIILYNVKKHFHCSSRNIKYYRWLTVLMLLPLIVPGIEILWHMGSRVCWPVRFAFLITFTLADHSGYLLAAEECTIEEDKRQNVALPAVIGLIIAAGIVWNVFLLTYNLEFSQAEWLAVLSVLIFTGVGIIIWSGKDGIWKRTAIICLICAEVFGNLAVWLSPSFLIVPEETEYLKTSGEISDKIVLPENNLVRIKDYYGIFDCNYAFPMASRSVSNFVHIIPSELQDAFYSLGYSTNYTRLLDRGGTVFSDALMGMQYVLSDERMEEMLYEEKTLETDENIFWYESRYPLPMGVYMDREPDYNENFFAYQNEIFKVITNLDEELIRETGVDENGYRKLSLEGQNVIYFYSDSSEPVRILINDIPFVIGNGRGFDRNNLEYPATYHDGLVCLGTFDGEDVEVQFLSEEAYDYSEIKLGILNLEALNRGVSEVNENSDVQMTVGKTSLEISCTADNSTYLFLPVGYDKGWNAAVNGEQVEIASFLGAFMAIPLEEGVNEIQMNFTPEGTRLGRVFTVLGILGLMIWLFIKMRGIDWKIPVADQGIYVIHSVIWFLFLIGFFVLPMIGDTLVAIVLILNHFFPSTQNFINDVASFLDHFRSSY